MIVARATITITAENDEAVDEVYRAIHPLDEGWPNRVVQIRETSREVER